MTAGATITPIESWLTGSSGRIFTREWKPAGTPRAVLVICHGVNSHSGQYLWAGEQLAAAGLAVFALDLRGRGKSDGERFYVQRIEDYTSDLGALIARAKTSYPGLPVFLLGHSAGGVTSCVYVLDHPGELAGFICESFAFQVYAPDWALALLKGVAAIAPRLRVLRLKNEDFSRNPAIVRSMNEDPLIQGEVQPTQTVAALARASDRLKGEFRKMQLPVLILHGTNDKVTKPGGSRFMLDNVGSGDKTLKLYDEHVHDLLNDVGRDRVMADIRGWIDARIAAPVEATPQS